MRAALCLLLLLCIPRVSHAQVAVVEQAKADLKAAGVQVENKACTDFEIAKLVAGRIPGAGLLTKDCCGDANDPNRSHCELNGVWYAHDIVAFGNGAIADIAADGGGSNGPTWQLADPDPGLISRYRSAASLGLTGLVPGAGPVPPVVVPVPPTPVVDLKPLLDRISVLEQSLVNLKNAYDQLVAAQQATDAKATDLATAVNGLKLPTGCRVQFLACRLNY